MDPKNKLYSNTRPSLPEISLKDSHMLNKEVNHPSLYTGPTECLHFVQKFSSPNSPKYLDLKAKEYVANSVLGALISSPDYFSYPRYGSLSPPKFCWWWLLYFFLFIGVFPLLSHTCSPYSLLGLSSPFPPSLFSVIPPFHTLSPPFYTFEPHVLHRLHWNLITPIIPSSLFR